MPSSAIKRSVFEGRTFTAEFKALLLTSEIDDSNKRDIMVEHIDDARRLGAEVLPPNIQTGEAEFTVSNGKIVFGLLAIKGLDGARPRTLCGLATKGGRSRTLSISASASIKSLSPSRRSNGSSRSARSTAPEPCVLQLWDALGGRLASRQPGSARRQEAWATQPF